MNHNSISSLSSPGTVVPAASPLLEVHQLSVHYPLRRTLLGKSALLKAVDGISFSINAGETLGLVGESGCGKSTVARAIVRLVQPTQGKVLFDGTEISSLPEAELRPWRRHLQMIFQDPYGSLDPRMRAGEIIGEALDIHKLALGADTRAARIETLLRDVGLKPEHALRYPHEFSGGQRQRIGIARALAVEPRLIVCDEPVSALDVSVQAQIVNLLRDLQEERGLAYLFIAHDLAVVEHISRRVAVMYLGRVVETGLASRVAQAPRHPYTAALLSAIPEVDPAHQRARIILRGDVPFPVSPPSGCPFHPRCPIAQPRCQAEVPALREVEPERWAACHFPL